MLALSTSWKSSTVENGEQLVEAVLETGVGGIELEYRITDIMFHQMRSALKRSGLRVVSIHNYFPFPTALKGLKPGGDLFLLSHPDGEQRRLAVNRTIRTMEHANDLEAPVVVVHCGFVAMAPELQTLRDFFTAGQMASEAALLFIETKQAELENRKAVHLDSLLFSLDRLLRSAEKLDVTLALENRYHYHELPGFDDFDAVFSEFGGAPLGYWHDTGHARANELLGMVPAGEPLNRYRDRLVGIHLHDARELSDHLPPGKGAIDFDAILPCLKPDTPAVMELQPGTPDAETAAGIAFLREKGFGTSSTPPGGPSNGLGLTKK